MTKYIATFLDGTVLSRQDSDMRRNHKAAWRIKVENVPWGWEGDDHAVLCGFNATRRSAKVDLDRWVGKLRKDPSWGAVRGELALMVEKRYPPRPIDND